MTFYQSVNDVWFSLFLNLTQNVQPHRVPRKKPSVKRHAIFVRLEAPFFFFLETAPKHMSPILESFVMRPRGGRTRF